MTKSSKHFRQKTKTKSKIAGKINTAPHRLHDGDTAANASTFSGGPKEYFRRLHLEVLDSWIVCLNNRFSSEAFNRIEPFKRAVVGKINCETGAPVWDSKDLNMGLLEVHLDMFGDVCRARNIRSMHDIRAFFKGEVGLMELFRELVRTVKLFYTLPVTMCTAERSFGGLRRLKTICGEQ